MVAGADGTTDMQRLNALLARWQGRAWLYEAIENEARQSLENEDPDDVTDLIEQHLTTEQTEYIAEFLFALRVTGCEAPERLAAFIDRHNAMVTRLLDDLDREREEGVAIGTRYKRRLWRLKTACFNDRIKAAAMERLNEGRLLLSLKDLERFMALHMDPTLCRDRLDALVKAGLLKDELRPNIRLFWSEGRLEELVGEQLSLVLHEIGAS